MSFPASVESQGAARYIYEKATGAAGLTALVSTRVYESLAPEGAVLPYVVYNLQAGVSVQASGGCGRLMVEQEWLVKAVTESGGYLTADTISKQIDAALNATSGTVVIEGVTYTVMGVFNDAPVRYLENHVGRRIFHSGGVYRLQVRAD